MEPQPNEVPNEAASTMTNEAAGLGLSIVVPAYNEARRLAGTLPRVIEYARRLAEPVEVILVDDGSVDGTSDVATSIGRASGLLTVLRIDQNRGKGAAVRRGMLAARFGHVLFTDADMSTPIEETGKLRAALAGGADVAIGSRRLARSDVQVHQPWLRDLAGRTFSGLVSLLLVPGVRDSQCGFKAFHRAVAREVFGRQRLEGFGFDAEVLWLTRRLGYRVAEVPIVWRDDSRSNVRLFRDSGGMLLDLGRVRLNAWRGRYPLPRSGSSPPSEPSRERPGPAGR
ncbi:MAG TPA: dolichyl-phosphate beta-glucosyltransferase [Methylomirabilota bacterium]|jgi:dolichyl-phosphate beta-glucosyltransferase|nr:dolichyl-phosphate beta-glucosyltransferase [Methylomirabilota bacterium]